jgi:hypothetical protein
MYAIIIRVKTRRIIYKRIIMPPPHSINTDAMSGNSKGKHDPSSIQSLATIIGKSSRRVENP